MGDWMNTLKGVFMLDEATFTRFVAAENTMKRGVFVLLACFLVVAFPVFVEQLIDNVRPFTAERAAEFEEEFLSNFERFAQFMPEGDQFQGAFIEQFRENFRYGLDIAVAIENLPRSIPRPVGGFLQALGAWISNPLAHLGAWLAYAIWVLLFAKMTGGNGLLNPFLGATALYAVPNLLGFFNFVPFIGPAVALVGAIWGWAAYVRGVQVSQGFTVGKAALVAALPILVLVLIASVLALAVALAVGLVVGAAQG